MRMREDEDEEDETSLAWCLLYSLVQVLVVLLLCDQRLLLVVLMQLLFQFLCGRCRRLRLRRGAQRFVHEGAGWTRLHAVAIAAAAAAAAAAFAAAALVAALRVPQLALASLLRARLVNTSYGIGESSLRGGKVALRPELAASRSNDQISGTTLTFATSNDSDEA